MFCKDRILFQAGALLRSQIIREVYVAKPESSSFCNNLGLTGFDMRICAVGLRDTRQQNRKTSHMLKFPHHRHECLSAIAHVLDCELVHSVHLRQNPKSFLSKSCWQMSP